MLGSDLLSSKASSLQNILQKQPPVLAIIISAMKMRLSGFTVAKLGFADSQEMELAAREALDQA
jgi:hypothetical protein